LQESRRCGYIKFGGIAGIDLSIQPAESADFTGRYLKNIKPYRNSTALFIKVLQFRATGRIVCVTLTFVYITLLVLPLYNGYLIKNDNALGDK